MSLGKKLRPTSSHFSVQAGKLRPRSVDEVTGASYVKRPTRVPTVEETVIAQSLGLPTGKQLSAVFDTQLRDTHLPLSSSVTVAVGSSVAKLKPVSVT
jgi:hypothetical protein